MCVGVSECVWCEAGSIVSGGLRREGLRVVALSQPRVDDRVSKEITLGRDSSLAWLRRVYRSVF